MSRLKSKQIPIILCGFILLLFITYGNIYAEVDPELADALQKILDDCVKKSGIPGATAAVTLPDQGTWIGASGMANQKANIAMTPDSLFRIASVTKTFVAATVLKLTEDGILTLEDPVEQWLPGIVPNGENIKVRYLLNHTSGLFDDMNFWSAEVAKDRNRVWQPEEIMAIVATRPPEFAPGEGYEYCNTGYILLGMIIEEATGSPVEQEIRQRLLEPLQLDHTFLGGREHVPDGLAQSPTAPDPYTSTETMLWTAGAMISNAGDLVKWAKALYDGDVLEQASRDEMLAFNVFGRGLGVSQEHTPMGDAVGHPGGIYGWSSYMFHIPDTGVTIVALASQFGVASDIATAILQRLLDTEAVSAVGKMVTNWGDIKSRD